MIQITVTKYQGPGEGTANQDKHHLQTIHPVGGSHHSESFGEHINAQPFKFILRKIYFTEFENLQPIGVPGESIKEERGEH